MHFYNFNIADFNNSTRHLTLVERALYRDLIDMYYHNESAIDASDMDKLARRLICKTDEDRQALEYVLDEFFKRRGNKYYHHRIDKEIKNYRYKNGNGNSNTKGNDVTQGVTNDVTDVTQGVTDVTHDVTPSNDRCNVTCNDDTPMSNAERVRKYRQERKQLTSALESAGVSVDDDINMTKLRELHTSHFKNVTHDVTKPVTPSNDDCNARNAKNAVITKNQEPRTINQKPNLNETLNNNSAGESVSEFQSIADWNPPALAEINELLKSECPAMPEQTSDSYSKHFAKFKNYYVEKELAGYVIITEARRTDLLVDWIKREWTYQQKKAANSKLKTTSNNPVQQTNWSQVGKKPSSGRYQDSDMPAGFHPSHRPVRQIKEPVADHVYFIPPQHGGNKYPLLPGMSQAETYAYTLEHKRSDETQEQAYLRIADELEVA